MIKINIEYESVLVDAIETPIERPKGAKEVVLRQEKAAYAWKHEWWLTNKAGKLFVQALLMESNMISSFSRNLMYVSSLKYSWIHISGIWGSSKFVPILFGQGKKQEKVID